MSTEAAKSFENLSLNLRFYIPNVILCRWIDNGDEPLRGHGDHRPDGAREGDLQPGHQVGKQHGGDVLRENKILACMQNECLIK